MSLQRAVRDEGQVSQLQDSHDSRSDLLNSKTRDWEIRRNNWDRIDNGREGRDDRHYSSSRTESRHSRDRLNRGSMDDRYDHNGRSSDRYDPYERDRIVRREHDERRHEPKRSNRYFTKERFDRHHSNRQQSHERERSKHDESEDFSRSESGKQELKQDAAAIAAAKAASIVANLKQSIAEPPTPPPPPPLANTLPPLPAINHAAPRLDELKGSVYYQDGEYVRDIEINDIRNKFLLTKATSQIKNETGADLQVKGKYFPNKAMATEREPPLYLHITSSSEECLNLAIKKVEDLITRDLGSLVDERRFRRQDSANRDEFGRKKWPFENLPLNMVQLRQFNVRQAIVGAGAANVKHITSQTRARVQLKGIGSGFCEPETGMESNESLYLQITAPDQEKLQLAKVLAENLIESVKAQYNMVMGQQDSKVEESSSNAYSQYNSVFTGAPPPPGFSSSSFFGPSETLTSSTTDPYAAYGGYQGYMKWYNSHQTAPTNLASDTSQQSPPPPPPPEDTQPRQPAPPKS